MLAPPQRLPRLPRPCRAGLLALVLVAPVAADTLKVPSDAFPTIQAAVDGADEGDVIVVAKGVYEESVFIGTNGLSLVGKKAVIDAALDDDCIHVEADDVSISGFVLVNGTAGVRGESYVEGSFPANRLSVTRCVIRSCAFGITVSGEAPNLTRNTVVDCSEVGIAVEATTVDRATVSRNVVARIQGDGIRIHASSTLLDRNRVSSTLEEGIAVELLGALKVFAPGPPSTFSDNRVTGALGVGLSVNNPFGSEVTLEGNRLVSNGRGLQAVGREFLVLDNECRDNVEIGMLLGTKEISHFVNSEVRGNLCQDNGEDGMRIDGPLLCRIDGGDTVIVDNTCIGNGRDGIVIDHAHFEEFRKNVCKKNGGEGIDIEVVDFGMVLDGNVCAKNLHEGIDNSGVETVMRDNVCKGNGLGLGPDLAGTGKAGAGSVLDEGGNTFATGGFDVPSRVDVEE